MNYSRHLLAYLCDNSVWILLVAVCIGFATQSEQFATWSNALNIGVQASSAVVVATGMTFVLLTAGVDLSAGSIMFLSAAVAGTLARAGVSFPACVGAMLIVGLLCSVVNAALITRHGIVPLVVTLGTLYIGRGFALWLTETRAINLPEPFVSLGTARVGGIPVPILISVAVVVAAQGALSLTPFGKHILAIGHSRSGADKAGISSKCVLFAAYLISGVLASIGALLSMGQLGAVSPTFGTGRELTAIAAAVIGGTSLFGGRGSVFPGTVMGAILIQTVENGLVILNADPYLYPLVMSGIIFFAVLIDGTRIRFARPRAAIVCS